MLNDKIMEYLEEVEALLREHSSAAVDAGLMAMRIDAASYLIPSVVGLVACVIIAVITGRSAYEPVDRFRLEKAVQKSYPMRSAKEDAMIQAAFNKSSGNVLPGEELPKVLPRTQIKDEDTQILRGVIVFGCVCFGVVSSVFALNIWYWVGVFSPELYVIWKYLL